MGLLWASYVHSVGFPLSAPPDSDFTLVSLSSISGRGFCNKTCTPECMRDMATKHVIARNTTNAGITDGVQARITFCPCGPRFTVLHASTLSSVIPAG